MIPGPDRVVACPNCQALAWHPTIKSGNTLGARYWTDGKRFAPMLAYPPSVVKCHRCGECYWLAKANEVGTVEWYSKVEPAWAAAEEVKEPSEGEYYQTLQAGLAGTPEEERSLRILAWWRRNDAFRDILLDETESSLLRSREGRLHQDFGYRPRRRYVPPATSQTASELWRENLQLLEGLLNDGDEKDRLMKAEGLRERGDFESAKGVLCSITSAEYASAARQLRFLCDAGDPTVRELDFRSQPLP